MISVIIPVLNEAADLPRTLAALVPAAVEGLVQEVIVADGGSTDATAAIADDAGARLLESEADFGHRLAAGAHKARFPWLLFLRAGTVLGDGWERDAASFMARVDAGQIAAAAAAFRFALDDQGLRPRLVEAGVAMRCALLRSPRIDQGLLIPKRLYQELGGFRSRVGKPDLDFARRLGRGRIVMLRSRAVSGRGCFKLRDPAGCSSGTSAR